MYNAVNLQRIERNILFLYGRIDRNDHHEKCKKVVTFFYDIQVDELESAYTRCSEFIGTFGKQGDIVFAQKLTLLFFYRSLILTAYFL